MSSRITLFELSNFLATLVTPGATSANVQFKDDGKQDIMLFNTGTVTTYVRVGDSSVTVTPTDGLPLLSGEKGMYRKGMPGEGHTHIAFVTDTVAGALTIAEGDGS